MKFKNGWASHNKQWDKINIKLRISFLTLLGLHLDWSSKTYSFTLLNLTICSDSIRPYKRKNKVDALNS